MRGQDLVTSLSGLDFNHDLSYDYMNLNIGDSP